MENSYGKIILVGEHAVKYRKPAIALPLRAINTKTKISKNKTFVIKSSFGVSNDESSVKEHAGFVKMIESFLKKHKITNNNFSLEIKSNSPTKSGLGSSAQAAHSIMTALSKYFNIKISNKKLFEYIQIAENYHQNNSSGIDAMTIINNAPTYYRKTKGNKILNINFEGYIIVATTKVDSMSQEAETVVSNYCKENKREFNKTLRSLTRETKNARKALLDNDFNLLKSAMTNSQMLLENIGVSDYLLETLINVAIKNGASAAKVTGGGIGGSIIALSKNRDVAKEVANSLTTEGVLNTYIIDISQL